MNGSEHLTTVEAWRAWKEACAADLCSRDVAATLHRFGTQRFRVYVERYASRVGHHGDGMQVTEANDAWHLLETHAQTGSNRAGKRYKDWLFMRADANPVGWLGSVEAGATLLMRDVAREYLRREHAASFMESLNRPRGGGDTPSFTLEDLLPGHVEPLSEIEAREWDELGREQAAGFLPTLNTRERVALWAHCRDIPFADPELAEWVGCRKSVIYSAYRDAVARLCRSVKSAYPDESPAIWLMVTSRALEQLDHLIISAISSEKGAARFFKKKGIDMPTGEESR